MHLQNMDNPARTLHYQPIPLQRETKHRSQKIWQNILDEINKAIRAMDQKIAQTKAYAGIASHLYNVKIAWRNQVMHPKQTYTIEEARAIFTSAETFVRDLATKI
jgi:hypothetical protein